MRDTFARVAGRRDNAAIGKEIARVQASMKAVEAELEKARGVSGEFARRICYCPNVDEIRTLKEKLEAARADIAAVMARQADLSREHDALHRELDAWYQAERVRTALGGRTLPPSPTPPATPEDTAALQAQLRARLTTLAKGLRELAIVNEDAIQLAAALNVIDVNGVGPWPELRVQVNCKFVTWIGRAVEAGLVDRTGE